MPQFWKIDAPDEVDKRLAYLGVYLKDEWDFSRPVAIYLKPWSKTRSLNANALMHVWFREMAEYFTAKGVEISEEDAKLLMKNLFLGKEDIVIGKTIIEGQLRRTANLDGGEVKQFMDQVLAWAADKGVSLSQPEDSEYAQWSREHG